MGRKEGPAEFASWQELELPVKTIRHLKILGALALRDGLTALGQGTYETDVGNHNSTVYSSICPFSLETESAWAAREVGCVQLATDLRTWKLCGSTCSLNLSAVDLA